MNLFSGDLWVSGQDIGDHLEVCINCGTAVLLIELQACGNRNRKGSAFALSSGGVFAYFVYLEKAAVCKLLTYYFPWNGNHLDYFNEF